MRVAVLGGSGTVGRRVVRRLLSYGADVVEQVVLVNRRIVEAGVFPDGDLRLSQHLADLSSSTALEAASAPILRDVDVIVSTIGIGSGKGTAEQFRAVEVELPGAFARAARAGNVRRAVLLTGVGADIESKSAWLVGGAAGGKFFHFKGLVEKNFADLAFPDGVAAFRPGGLLGTGHVPPFVDWLLPKIDWIAPVRFRCIHVDQLALAMARVAVDSSPLGGGQGGVTVFQGERLFDLLPDDRRHARAVRGVTRQGDSSRT